MSAPQPAPPRALHDRAADDLRYIRATMERAGAYTAVSGAGYMVLGVSALVAAFVAARTSSAQAWLTVWLVELVVAMVAAVVLTARKAKRLGTPLVGGAGRKLILGFAPVMIAGAALTWALSLAGAEHLLPGTWLSVYGAAVVAGGVYSIRPVPMLGGVLLVLGTMALLVPGASGDVMLAIGFGGMHLIWGILIAWRHGG